MKVHFLLVGAVAIGLLTFAPIRTLTAAEVEEATAVACFSGGAMFQGGWHSGGFCGRGAF
jgi:hypothetical protein